MRKKTLTGVFALIIALCILSAVNAQEPDFNFYFGNLHAHTSYSDGMGTPSDAYSQVSTKGDMDFYALTEHGYYLQELTNIHLWYKSIEEADSFYKAGEFVPLVGYEWTHAEGHMNGYGTPKAASRDTQRNFTAFIDYLHEFGGFAAFNHPNPEIQPNWNDFSYWSYADKVVSMIEVGSGAYYRNTRNEPSYIKALDRGWKIGAVNNQDNHRDDWGSAANVRTGLIAKDLTRRSVMDAMRSMRTYATEDRNARVMITSGQSIMGDTIIFKGSGSGLKFNLDIFAKDPDGETFSSIKLITNGGRVVGSVGQFSGGTYSFTIEPNLDYNYYYAKLVQADGDTIITTPIWMETGSGIVASDFKMEDVFISKGKQAVFYARVADRNGQEDVRTKFSLMADYGDGFVEVASGTIDIQSGRWSHLLAPWIPDKGGRIALKLVLGSKAGDQQFMAGQYEVLEQAPKSFAVDEGHNNRLTSYYGGLVAIGKGLGYEGKVIDDTISKVSLEGLEVLIIPLPEQGFALKPTYYEEGELNAIAGWVQGGGSLLLLGWGDNGDGTRDTKDFNSLLSLMESGLSFRQDLITTKGAAASFAQIGLPSGKYKASFTEAGSIIVADGIESFMAFISKAEGFSAESMEKQSNSDPVIAAGRLVGKGRIMLLGTVPISDYELGKSGFDNSNLAKVILKWLFEGRW